MNRLLPFLQLVRLPNVFTAFADILLAALAVHASGRQWITVAFLLLASGCLYCGGMVWNDFFDLEQDRRERPSRPLPSGRVSRTTAAGLGAALLGCGWLAALTAGSSMADHSWAPVWLATLLVIAILAYDAWLKRTWSGPLAMGTCRFLNVLLGLTAGGAADSAWGLHLAAVVGIYIVGVTWFARTEAAQSDPVALLGAAATMLASLLLALTLPARLPPGTSSLLFPYLLVALAFAVGLPVSQAIALPTPPRVQPAVKRALMGLVLLDAVLATGVAGWYGLLILGLLVPILYLRKQRWLYVT
jgi:4-hydroxybenzoate polyprenyltransferase